MRLYRHASFSVEAGTQLGYLWRVVGLSFSLSKFIVIVIVSGERGGSLGRMTIYGSRF